MIELFDDVSETDSDIEIDYDSEIESDISNEFYF